jgi:cytoskeleton protein RodZ
MTSREIGELLRQERMQQGMSLETVMQFTKVSRRHLEALEDGRTDDLPHSVYVKGFVKAYAEVLKLEIKGLPQILDNAYGGGAEDGPLEERHRPLGTDITLSKGSRGKYWPKVLLALLLVALLAGTAYGVWYLFFTFKAVKPVVEVPARIETTPEPSVAPPASRVAPPTAPEPAPMDLSESIVSEPEPAEGNMTAEPDPSAIVDSPPQEQEGSEESAPLREALESLQEQPIVIASAEARAADAEVVHILQVVGKGECWIEAKVDRDFTTDFYVREGELVEIRFTRVLAVKFGNIGVVSLNYNGAPFSTSIPPSGVKTLTFPPAP